MYCYSNRLVWEAGENAFTSLVEEQRRAGRQLFDLTVSNPSLALADYPHAEIRQALCAISDFRYQPTPFGDPQARAVIAQRLNIAPQDLALTASTSEAYSVLFKLLANPGDEVLVPSPSYPLFEYLAQLEGVTPKPYRLGYDGAWHIDFASLEQALSARTRAIVLVNPNNPTGSFLKAAEYRQLVTIAAQKSLPLISDEVFTDYGLFPAAAERMETLNGVHDILSFTLNGLSKSAGMPQMKLAWIVVNGPAGERRKACARLELVLDTYLSVSAPVQLAVAKLLEAGDRIQGHIRRRIQNNISALKQLLHSAPIHMLHLEGGWSAVLRMPNLLDEESWITRLLLEQGVVVQPGYFFDMGGNAAFLVVSLLTEESMFSSGIAHLLALTQ